jgi:hypothetical protein
MFAMLFRYIVRAIDPCGQSAILQRWRANGCRNGDARLVDRRGVLSNDQLFIVSYRGDK